MSTTERSSGVAEPGEMITYGRWIRNPATTATTRITPTADSAQAATACLRRRSAGTTGGAAGGGDGGGIVAVMRLRRSDGYLGTPNPRRAFTAKDWSRS